jgi:hypothetical protein
MSKSCPDCSWYEVNFGDGALCTLRTMEQLLEETK